MIHYATFQSNRTGLVWITKLDEQNNVIGVLGPYPSESMAPTVGYEEHTFNTSPSILAYINNCPGFYTDRMEDNA